MNYMSLGFDGTSHRAQEDIEASCFLTQNYHLYTSERFETIRLAAENQQQLLDTIGAAFKHVAQMGLKSSCHWRNTI